MNMLTKSRYDKRLAGVCGGIAAHFGWDAGRVRLAFILMGLFGCGILLYIVLWIVLPEA